MIESDKRMRLTLAVVYDGVALLGIRSSVSLVSTTLGVFLTVGLGDRRCFGRGSRRGWVLVAVMGGIDGDAVGRGGAGRMACSIGVCVDDRRDGVVAVVVVAREVLRLK